MQDYAYAVTPHADVQRVMVARCTSAIMPTGTTATLCSTFASIRRMMLTSYTTYASSTLNGTRMTAPTAASYIATTSSVALAFGQLPIVHIAVYGYTSRAIRSQHTMAYMQCLRRLMISSLRDVKSSLATMTTISGDVVGAQHSTTTI